MKKKLENKERILILAEKVRLLFGFCTDLIGDIDLLESTAVGAASRTDMTLTMAPILGAFGQDYEDVHFKRDLERKRANALFNLVKVLRDTEKEREEWTKKQERKRAGLAQLRGILGSF